MNKKRNNSAQKNRIVYIVFIIILLAGGYVQKFGLPFGEEKKEESKIFAKNTDTEDVETDEIPTEETKAEEQESGEIKGRRNLANDVEAPSEGLSRIIGEDLEQPAPLSGEIILFKNSFVVSYNIETKCPNYVAWCLTKSRLDGRVSRYNYSFIGDETIGEASRVETQDYSGSGYDRGHMCPAADNSHEEMSMMQSFMMTNICPQNHNLNSGDWKELEEQCRQWVKDYSELYIVCGPIFDKKNPRTIGKRKGLKIAVPDRFFKVVLMIGKNPKAIGFIYPNAETNKDIRDYCVTVDRVESITGIDFYPSLPDDVEKKVEAECKPAAWGI